MDPPAGGPESGPSPLRSLLALTSAVIDGLLDQRLLCELLSRQSHTHKGILPASRCLRGSNQASCLQHEHWGLNRRRRRCRTSGAQDLAGVPWQHASSDQVLLHLLRI